MISQIYLNHFLPAFENNNWITMPSDSSIILEHFPEIHIVEFHFENLESPSDFHIQFLQAFQLKDWSANWSAYMELDLNHTFLKNNKLILLNLNGLQMLFEKHTEFALNIYNSLINLTVANNTEQRIVRIYFN